MAVKNHKPKQVSKGVPEQSKSHSTKPGPTAHSYNAKFVVRNLITNQHSPVSNSKIRPVSGYKRKLNIKPLPPHYPDSLFQSKEDYDAMVQEVIKNAKDGKAIMRDTALISK